MFLQECRTSITKLKGIGNAAASAFSVLGITQVRQFLEYYPRTYINRIKRIPFAEFNKGDINTEAEVIAHDYIHYKNKKVLKVFLQDESGTAAIVCFGRNFLKPQLEQGNKILIAGTFQHRFGELQSSSFDFEPISDNPRNFGRIIPVYPLSGKLNQGIIRTAMDHAVKEYGRYVDNELSDFLIREKGLLSKQNALKQIHFPKSEAELEQAVQTLKYEEMFYFQLIMGKRYSNRKKISEKLIFSNTFFDKIIKSLPFKLTADQITSVEEIKNDLGTGMHRLLQGDVGSGKTLVALLAASLVVEKGWQTALMAPTELLARQHAAGAAEMLSPFGINVAYISGGITTPQKRNLLNALTEGEINIIVGTHALFSESMVYKNLRLIIIDEQQRFGVDQRAKLIEKSKNPDLLLMTATPIPRTLALTAFGDLETTTIRTMPEGRKPVITHLARQGNEEKVYTFVEKELKAGHQAYFVYPLLEESKSLDIKAAETMAEHLSQRYPDFTCGLVHGRLKEEEKNRIMKAFKANEIQILAATSVVEVGVDIANASCMVIEHAERFGLSALHQLRGRVGRSKLQSYAFLVYSNKLSDDGKARLKIMKETTDGFKIAEEDLKIRGPGELMGAKQSGYIPFKLADIVTDAALVMETRETVKLILKADPGLLKPEHVILREVLNKVPPFENKF